MPSFNKYNYDECPLPKPTSLRYLLLLPAKESDEIICELTTDNEKNESYEALSYCWGGQNPDVSIKIRDKINGMLYDFAVSETLRAALKRLRYESTMRVLWVDAICINQKNVLERNEQVPMMSDIYSKAKSVCVWLGDHDEDSKEAIKFIKDRVLKLEEFDSLLQDESTGSQWMAMSRLMGRQWFSRRWVVQEIALASKATLHCGEDTISWQDFADAVSLFIEAEKRDNSLSKIIKTDTRYDNVPGFFAHVSVISATRLVDATSNLLRRTKVGESDITRIEPLRNLEYLVSTLSTFEASEPRDTIYALLAIARDTFPRTNRKNVYETLPAIANFVEWSKPKISSEVYVVNYDLDLLDVCKDFIAFAVRRSEGTKALDILCRPWWPEQAVKNDGTPKKTWPSWIPGLSKKNFAVDGAASVIGRRMRRINADPLVGLPGVDEKKYSAAGSRSFARKIQFESGGRDVDFESVFVEGFILDEVNNLCERSSGGNIPLSWLELAKWKPTDREAPPDEFWRTLVANRGPNGSNALGFYPRACYFALQRAIEDDINTTQLIDHGRCGIVADFLWRVQAVIWNRSLMRSKCHHLGLVPRSAKDGDLICIFYGCTVPIILRKHEKTADQIEKQWKIREARYKDDRILAAKTFWRLWKGLKSRKQNAKKKKIEKCHHVLRADIPESGHTLQVKHQPKIA
ncbi:hypothetical protein NHQ30_001513 [Ciborinia camelliae]|nr:hypothetical protein NHQ30_001513 [Ciborinia camelliae]